MAGSIHYRKDRGYWCVYWYWNKKRYAIYHYKGEKMYDKRIAQKCLNLIQGDYEQYLAGLGPFRIEKYTGKNWTDVIEYFQDWMENIIEPKRKPATIKGYWSYFHNWIKPFFEEHSVMLHEVQLDTLTKLLNSIKLSPKGKYNVMNCFHSFMDYAWRSRRIPEMPPFPKKEDYNLVTPVISWLPEERQMKIINAIPEQNRPVFLWLKYHLRRPGEACVLKWSDYDNINDAWLIRRTLSDRKIVETTKTNTVHVIPNHPAFPVKNLRRDPHNPFVFINPRSRKNPKRYTLESLGVIWKRACEMAGESISMYAGLKHSSCSQYINEKGLSLGQLQMLTDHANLASVKCYGKIELDLKRRLMATDLSPVCPPGNGKVKNLYE